MYEPAGIIKRKNTFFSGGQEMEKIKNLLLYAGLDKETNSKYKDFVLKQDVKRLTLYLLIAGTLYLILFAASMVTSGFAHVNSKIYLLTALSFLVIFLLQGLTVRKRGHASKINRIYIYMFMMVLYVESIVLTSTHRDFPAVTYIGVLLILPLLFAQYPLPMVIFQSCFVAIFCVLVSIFKYPEVAAIDVWNGITFLMVSVIVIFLVIPMRFSQIIQPEIIRELSERDMLTKLKNRNSYELYCSSITKIDPSVVYIYADANGLHELNNQYGHEAGDNMLKAVAKVMMNKFGSDNTYRIGGDEFVAVYSGADREQTEKQITEIKQELSGMGYHLSAGYAFPEEPDNEIDDVIKRAEAKMYEDKKAYYSKQGKDRRHR